jgi:hypothetical protein
MCEVHLDQARRRTRLRIALLIALVVVLVGILIGYACVLSLRLPDGPALAPLAAGCCAVVVGAWYFADRFAQWISIQATEITSRRLCLEGVSPAFAEAVADFEDASNDDRYSDPQEDRFRR